MNRAKGIIPVICTAMFIPALVSAQDIQGTQGTSQDVRYEITGGGTVLQILPGPAVYADSAITQGNWEQMHLEGEVDDGVEAQQMQEGDVALDDAAQDPIQQEGQMEQDGMQPGQMQGHLDQAQEGFYSDNTAQISGSFDLTVVDRGESGDEATGEAEFTTQDGSEYRVVITDVDDSSLSAEEPRFGGVGIQQDLYGSTGRYSPLFPAVRAEVALWGRADVFRDGNQLHTGAPVQVMLTSATRGDDYRMNCYNCLENEVSELHLILESSDGFSYETQGGFLYVAWEDATFQRSDGADMAADPSAAQGAVGVVEDAGEGVVEGTEEAAEGVVDAAEGAVDTGEELVDGDDEPGAWDATQDAAGDVVEGTEDAAEGMAEGIEEGAEGVADVAEGAADTGADLVDSEDDPGIADTAGDVTGGIAEGAEEAAEGVADVAEGAVDAGEELVDGDDEPGAWEATQDAAGDVAEGTEDAAEGVAEGIEEGAEGVVDAADAVEDEADAMVTGDDSDVMEGAEGAAGFVAEGAEDAAEGMTEGTEEAAEGVADVADAAEDEVDDTFDANDTDDTFGQDDDPADFAQDPDLDEDDEYTGSGIQVTKDF